MVLVVPCCVVAAALASVLVLVLVIMTERATTVVNLGIWHGIVRNRGSHVDETKNRVLPVEVR